MLIATPKAVDANSYATIAEADSYFTDRRLYGDAWLALTTTAKEQALIWGTSLLDQCFDWDGAIRTQEQALRWPRSGAIDEDGRNLPYDDIPSIIKTGTFELANALALRDRSAEPEVLGLGLSRASVGPIDVTIDRREVISIIPAHVLIVLQQVGDVKGSAVAGDRVLKLERT